MKPWMTEAIGTQKVVLPSSVDQAALATSEKLSMPLRSLRPSSWCLLIEVERGVERTAGDEVAGGAAVEPRVERGVVFLRRRGRELDLDVGIVLVEGGDDLVVPDVGVVVAPALDLQRARLSGGEARHERRDRDGRAGNCLPCPVHRFSPLSWAGGAVNPRRFARAPYAEYPALRPDGRANGQDDRRRRRSRGRPTTDSTACFTSPPAAASAACAVVLRDA